MTELSTKEQIQAFISILKKHIGGGSMLLSDILTDFGISIADLRKVFRKADKGTFYQQGGLVSVPM